MRRRLAQRLARNGPAEAPVVRCGIEIRGIVGPGFAACLGPFDVETSGDTSVLRGLVGGHTQLQRVLRRLDDLGIEVVSVRVEPASVAAGA